VGEFQNGNMTGTGVYYYANGDRYEGGFRDGKRNGRGVFIFANGDRYQGTFKDGEIVGRGFYKLEGEPERRLYLPPEIRE